MCAWKAFRIILASSSVAIVVSLACSPTRPGGPSRAIATTVAFGAPASAMFEPAVPRTIPVSSAMLEQPLAGPPVSATLDKRAVRLVKTTDARSITQQPVPDQAVLTFFVGPAESDNACADGNAIGPFTLTLTADESDFSVEPESVELSAAAANPIATGSFSFCLTVEANFTGSVEVDGLDVSTESTNSNSSNGSSSNRNDNAATNMNINSDPNINANDNANTPNMNSESAGLVADAGVDQSVVSGQLVTLDGTASTSSAGEAITFAWVQSAGQPVALLDPDSPNPRFLAPPVSAAATLVFELTVQAGGQSGVDSVAITVDPTDQSRIIALWSNATSFVNVDIEWFLAPDATRFNAVSRTDSALSGAESAIIENSVLADGLHWLTLDVGGIGNQADVTYAADLPGFQFLTAERVVGGLRRHVVVDVVDGLGYPAFNGWLPFEHSDSGAPTGLHAAEVSVAWRNAAGFVNVDARLRRPNGQALQTDRQSTVSDSGLQGFERVIVPAGLTLEDGTYELEFEFNGSGLTADVTYSIEFPGVERRYDQLVQGNESRLVGLGVANGAATVVFNGWVGADDPDAGGVSGVDPVEVVAGWRDANNFADVEIVLRLPSQMQLPVLSNDTAEQGFERIFLPAGVALADGVYTLELDFNGSGQTAEVSYDVRFLNFTFSTTELLLGNTTRMIQLQLTAGSATVLANTW